MDRADTLLNFSPYTFNPHGHGGEKRTYQLKYLLENQLMKRIELVNSIYAPPQTSKKTTKYYTGFLKGRSIKAELNLAYKFSRDELVKLSLAYQHFEKQLEHYHEKVILWEMGCGYPHSWDFVIPAVVYPRCRLIALVHNLDSLIQGRHFINKKYLSPDWLPDEISILKKCDLVVTISREENWLLNLMGVNSIYLPFFPTGELLNICHRIRKAREENKSKEGFLLLGSTLNLPTRNAFSQIIETLKSVNQKIVVAGFGTENLKESVSGAVNIQLLGTLPQDQLESVLSEVKAVIVHSLPTTGALTRISELLASNIPIIANEFAARSYFDRKGLTIYKDFEHLENLLSFYQEDVNDLFEKESDPAAHVEAMVAKIRDLI